MPATLGIQTTVSKSFSKIKSKQNVLQNPYTKVKPVKKKHIF